jgi:hypothetical protein
MLDVFRANPARNQVMLALAYDAALHREELWRLVPVYCELAASMSYR